MGTQTSVRDTAVDPEALLASLDMRPAGAARIESGQAEHSSVLT